MVESCSLGKYANVIDDVAHLGPVSNEGEGGRVEGSRVSWLKMA